MKPRRIHGAIIAIALLGAGLLPASATGQSPGAASPPAAQTGSPAARAPSLAAFDELGTWIDIFDGWAFAKPLAAVRRAARHHVHTIFVETSNFSQPTAIHEPAATSRLIRAAHARGMQVVAWYLPGFLRPAFDYRRAMAAIHFHLNGQRFDAFALDIESSAVSSQKERSRRLVALSRRIDQHVLPSYPLSAIIPSPAGMQMAKGYWDDFPYQGIAPYYDVWQPMTYYTYHYQGPKGVYAYTRENTDILRTETGDPNLAISQIGGIASASSGLETGAFVRALLDDGLTGGSLYSLRGTGTEDWKPLQQLVP